MCSCRLLVVVWSVWHAVAGSNILVMFAGPSHSHAMLGDSLVQILLDGGHNVTYVTTYYTQVKRSDQLTVLDISSTLKNTGKHRSKMFGLARKPLPLHHILKIGTTFAREALMHEATQELLSDLDVTFDAVVAEWFYSELFAPLAAVYECPLIWYSAHDATWMNLRIMHGHTNPAYSVDLQATSIASTPSSVWSRALRLGRQAYLTAWQYYYTQYLEESTYRNIFKKALELRGFGLLDYETLVYNGSLLLVNSQPILAQFTPLPQNVRYVGGHHIELPPKPLPKDLQQLLDSSKNGVIFFSLGSLINSTEFPENMRNDLLRMFSQLEQTVIWKYEEPLQDLPKNVHVVEWAPQASILNHPNTVLLISHGGYLSYTEATTFGVPIIGIPFFTDHFVAMDLATVRGRGIKVDFSDDLAFKIKEAVSEIFGNSSYRNNAKHASLILQRNVVPPQKELLHWIELIINTGGASFLRSPAVNMPTMQRLHLDILAVVVMFFWFISKVVKYINVHLASTSTEGPKKNE